MGDEGAGPVGPRPGADGWRWNGHRWIPLTPWPSRWARLVAPVPGWLWVIGIAWLVLFGLLLPFVMETDASSATEPGASAHLQVLEVMAGIGAGSLVLWGFSLGWHRAWWAVAASIPVGTAMLLSWYVCAMFSLADPGDYTVDDAAAVGAMMVAVPTAAAVTILLVLGGGLGAGLRFIVRRPQGREPADPEGRMRRPLERHDRRRRPLPRAMDSATGSSASFRILMVVLSIPSVMMVLFGVVTMAVGVGAVPSDPAPWATKAELSRWLYWPDLGYGGLALLVGVSGLLWAWIPGRSDRSRLLGLPAAASRATPPEGVAVEFERTVPGSGNMTACGRQIWLGRGRAGQSVTVWASATPCTSSATRS